MHGTDDNMKVSGRIHFLGAESLIKKIHNDGSGSKRIVKTHHLLFL